MDYNRLERSYWLRQIDRIVQARDAISQRDSVTSTGRVLPGEDDLVFGTGRRVKAAVLFLDICGYSSRHSETHWEQDMLLRALTLFFGEMVRLVEEYGGAVEKNTGDGLMAYFEDGGGTPAAPGVRRALSAALTMFHVTDGAINIVLRNSSLEPFRFRVGLEYGWITVAKLGAARRFGSLAAVGTTANMASKMLACGGPGDLILGQAAKVELPPGLQTDYCTPLTGPTGWVYRLSGAMYPFYRYTGRWISPTGLGHV